MTQKVSPRKIETESLIQRAIELRKAGATYEVIGQQLQVSRSRAYQLVLEGLEVIKEQIRGEAGVLIALEVERLDNLLLGLWRDRTKPRVVDSILRILERKHKLQGLDAPTRIEASGLGGTSIQVNNHLSKISDEDLEFLSQLSNKYGLAVDQSLDDKIELGVTDETRISNRDAV